ncbi:MAG: FIG00995371: possibly secreted protein [uncultured Frankineae bacterium]|uniref:FIG00995371: possibly secreted protein n=1 Tax=uncultured Frankineae bacterium TaxID=437475 RepID=A0A6J4M5G8_9ACTN|nr:MAG: FIG00995371: possibly secreted protein [uncultured Frankineae bacterium]
MNTPSTLAAFAATLAVVFGASAGAGRLVGPVGAATPEAAAAASADGHADGGHEPAPDTAPAGGLDVGGLSVAADGYALRLARSTAPAGRPFRLEFTVTGPDGAPLVEYTRAHEKDLHLIVVRRDLTQFSHPHPTRDDAGRWSLPLTLPEPGTYKIIVDFTPAGRDSALTLAADLTVPGPYAPAPLPPPSLTAQADGFTVSLDGGLTAGRSSELAFTVRRDGRPVTDLDPYLGAYGHLVVLRAGDAAYLHVHPEESDAAGPEVVFAADVPAAGTHRLFLDFSVDGVVRTAELTVHAGAGGDPAGGSAGEGHGEDGHS